MCCGFVFAFCRWKRKTGDTNLEDGKRANFRFCSDNLLIVVLSGKRVKCSMKFVFLCILVVFGGWVLIVRCCLLTCG